MIKTIINFLKAIAHVEKIYDLCTKNNQQLWTG